VYSLPELTVLEERCYYTEHHRGCHHSMTRGTTWRNRRIIYIVALFPETCVSFFM